ncbi:hypothetical protein ACFQ87_34065, partial [Kitasatospora sp. NPDC056531]
SAATSSGETAMPTTGAYAPSSTGRTLPDAALGQGDLEPAIVTAMGITSDLSVHPRVAGMLNRFGDALHGLAGGSRHTQLWDQYTRDIRRTTS